ncbi:hypothetical protein YC2023_043055 [Brassica napus]
MEVITIDTDWIEMSTCSKTSNTLTKTRAEEAEVVKEGLEEAFNKYLGSKKSGYSLCQRTILTTAIGISHGENILGYTTVQCRLFVYKRNAVLTILEKTNGTRKASIRVYRKFKYV